MSERKISTIYVDVIQKGFEKLKTGLTAIKGQISATVTHVKTLNAGLLSVGNSAQRGFLAATASIGGFLRLADPVRFSRIGGTLGAIGVQLGSIFIPVLEAVQSGLNKVLDVLRSLTDQQKDNILKWVGIGVAVLGVIALIPKFIALVGVASGVVQFFGAVVGIASGGIVPLVGVLVTAGIALGVFAVAASQGRGILGTLRAAFEVFRPVVTVVVDALSKFVGIIRNSLAKLAPFVAQFVALVVPVVSRVAGLLGQALGMVVSFASKYAAGFVRLWTAVLPVLLRVGATVSRVVVMVLGLWSKLLTATKPIFDVLAGVIVRFADKLVSVVNRFAPIIDKVLAAVVSFVEKLIAFWTMMIDAAKPIFEAVEDVFIAFEMVAEEVIDAVSETVRSLVKVISELGSVFGVQIGDIMGTLTSMRPVFETAFQVMRKAVLLLCESLIFTVRLLKEIAAGNILGSLSSAFAAVDEFRKRIAEKDAKKKEGEQPEGNRLETEFTKPQNHKPIMQQKTDFVGFAEMWKKAQQATVETPEMMIQKEQLQLQKDAAKDRKQTVKFLGVIAGQEEEQPEGIFGA